MDMKSHYKMFNAGKLWITTLEANQGAEQIQKPAVTLHSNVETPSGQTTGTEDQANETTQDNNGLVAEQQQSTATATNQGSRSTDSQDQAYYIFQIVSLNGSKINNRQARLIVAVAPANPQGTVYVYVTDDNYSRRYQ